jgi:hypothetical protein
MRCGTALAALSQWQLALTDFESVLQHEPKNKAVQQQAEECRTMMAAVIGVHDAEAAKQAAPAVDPELLL